MRTILAVLLVAGFGGPVVAAEPAPGQKQSRAKEIAEYQARCQALIQRAEDTAKRKGQVWRPTDAPPARMELAVNRTLFGCLAPVIVRYDVEKK
jgi:hypothetical protein